MIKATVIVALEVTFSVGMMAKLSVGMETMLIVRVKAIHVQLGWRPCGVWWVEVVLKWGGALSSIR